MPDRIQANPKRSFTREDTNRASATVVHYAIVSIMFNTVKSISMNGNLILTSARKTIAVRLAALKRHFCQDDIDEMVSMTVERFLTKGAYDPSKSSLQTYVSRIATNVVYDFVKAVDKARGRCYPIDPRMESSLFTADHGADYQLLEDERERRLSQAVARLPLRHQTCFKLACEGRPYREIAALTDTTENNVSLIVYRLKNRLAADLRKTA